MNFITKKFLQALALKADALLKAPIFIKKSSNKDRLTSVCKLSFITIVKIKVRNNKKKFFNLNVNFRKIFLFGKTARSEHFRVSLKDFY